MNPWKSGIKEKIEKSNSTGTNFYILSEKLTLEGF